MESWYAPRAATPAELKEIREANRRMYGLDDEEAIYPQYVAIFDHYQEGCPGYRGKLALVVWEICDAYDCFIWEGADNQGGICKHVHNGGD